MDHRLDLALASAAGDGLSPYHAPDRTLGPAVGTDELLAALTTAWQSRVRS